MPEIFRQVAVLSLMGSILALGLMAVKGLFRQKLSANWHYYVWFILILRLLIPFSLPSSASMFNFIPHYQQLVDRTAGLSQLLTPTAPTAPVSQTFQAPQDSLDNSAAVLPSDENSTKIPSTQLSDDINAQPVQSHPVQPQPVGIPTSWLNWQNAAYIWIAGVIAALLYLLIVNGLLIFKIRKLKACDAGTIMQILEGCKLKLKVKTKVTVIYDDSLKSPALFGIMHPKLLISPDIIRKLSPEELRFVFLHELSHLKRRDLLLNLFVLLTQLVYWFNPVIWYALHKMKQDCEIACDATALAAINSQEHKKYGQTIISLLQLLSEPQWAPGTLGFVNKFNKRRIIMISTVKKTTIKWAVAALTLTLVVGCSSLSNPLNSNGSGQNSKDSASVNNQQTDPNNSQNSNTDTTSTPPSKSSSSASSSSSSVSQADSSSIVYQNNDYGFSFKLPGSWKGYSIINGQWQGSITGVIDTTGPRNADPVISGPILSIRHPLWTSQKPRQDIPIMVFTLKQWNSLQQGAFHIGAAPIGPSELGRNNGYVFALPARYNFAFPEGYEEVETILAGKPLQTKAPQLQPDSAEALLSNMMGLAKQGQVINSEFPVKTSTIGDVENAWGKANQTDYIAAAKGQYATYTNHQVVFGFNKGDQLFEVRSFDSRLKSMTLAQVKEVLGNPVYNVTSSGQQIIGYTAGTEFKIEMVFPLPTNSKPNPVMDHYNVLYPQGTINSMADDPGRQW